MRRKLALLGAPIVASLLVVSVFATQILIQSKAQTDIVFERPELDQLNEHEYNRSLDEPLPALAEATEEEATVTETEEAEATDPVETEAETQAPTEAPLDVPAEAEAAVVPDEPVQAAEPAAAFEEYTMYVAAEANLRNAPSTESEIEMTLLPNTPVRVTGQNGVWNQVRLQSGRQGYIHSNLLSETYVEIMPVREATETTAAPETPVAEAPLADAVTPEVPAVTQAPTSPAVSGTLYVSPEYAYIRSGPGTDYDSIGFALRGFKVSVLDNAGNWAKIQTEAGLVGYMSKDLLSYNEIERVASYLDTNKTVYVNVSFAYIRSGPTTSSDEVGGAELNEQLTQIQTDGSWSKVRSTAGVTGYIRNDLLTETVPAYPITRTPATEAPTQAAPPASDGFTAVGQTVYVTAAAANVRQYASIDSDRLTTVYHGNALTQVSTNGSWSKVTTAGGVTGYISNALFSATQPTSPTTAAPTAPAEEAPAAPSWEARDRYVWVFVSAANLRADASADSALVESLPRGTRLYQSATNGSWSKVTAPSGAVGYILNTLFQLDEIVIQAPEPTPAPVSGNALSRQTVVSAAMNQVGKPYVFASSNPAIGFDCSGLVLYAYRQAGYNMTHHGATQQGQLYGTYVSYTPGNYGTLLPGDLLFWGSSSIYTHVGIYIGNGQFVHAPMPGYTVSVASLTNYYRQPVVVKRLFP